MKERPFEVNDPVIVSLEHFAGDLSYPRKSFEGFILKIEPHKTLSTMYRVNDNNDVPMGRFYHHQLKLNISGLRDYKLKQLGI